MKLRTKPDDKVWIDFQEAEKISNEQLNLFKEFERFLTQRNQEFNLTAIKELSGIVRNHFQDSLIIGKHVEFKDLNCICDIGTGAGFPAIPIKILYPHLTVVLIEVTKKKVQFLSELINLLELKDVEICSLDWRTFLRKTNYKIDYFVTRATIDEVELIRAFKPANPYKTSTIVYWASQEWKSHAKAQPFISELVEYKLGSKHRKLVFFKSK